VVGEIVEAGGQAVACCASVADEDSAARIVDVALERFGRIDAVVGGALAQGRRDVRDAGVTDSAAPRM
jgi:NAD(P)-dependent dehydrogenase (short-subunit alcohol dehydrogenase family)